MPFGIADIKSGILQASIVIAMLIAKETEMVLKIKQANWYDVTLHCISDFMWLNEMQLREK